MSGKREEALTAIRERLPEFVSEKRLAHVLSVEKETVRMSALCGLSAAQTFILRKAALLHDLTHERSFEDQKAFGTLYALNLREEDLHSPAVLHQFTGAAVAADLFGLEKSGVGAIACHTTGKPDMTVPEMILCLADYIEETRPYPSCIELRRKFYENADAPDKRALLEAAMRAYLCGTVSHLCEKGAYIHPLTLEAMKFYENKLVNGFVL